MNIDKSNVLEKISLLIVGFYIFFGYILKKETLQLLATVIFGIITILSLNKYKIKLYKNDFMWLIVLLISIISLIYSIDKDSTIRYNVCFTLILMIKILLNNFNIKKSYILGFFIFFSSIHVVATIIYLIFPSFIQSICKLILTPQMYEYNVALMRYGANAGICSEHGFNAFCITIFTNVFFVKTVYSPKNKKRNSLLTLIGTITLLTTGKRGLFLANIFSMILVFAIINIMNKKVLKRFFLAILLVSIMLVIINNIPATQIIFERFKELDLSGNVLNGREIFYEKMFNNIVDNPILGSGASTTKKITGGNDGHNIYLQIFSELGIIGVFAYLMLFAHLLKLVFKSLKNAKDVENIFIALYYQIFFLIYGISGNPLYNFSMLLIYMIMINITIDSEHNNKILEE